MWFKYPESPQRARMLESMARNYFALPGRSEPAIAALARESVLPGEPKLIRPLQLPDHKLIDSGQIRLPSVPRRSKMKLGARSDAA